MTDARPVILFISTWSAADGLTTSTILPGVGLLLRELGIPTVLLSTLERGAPSALAPQDGLVHAPWIARSSGPKLMARALDQFGRMRELVRLVRRHQVGLIMARGSPAGSLAEAVSRRTGVPFVVESFEPHSEYMADTGVWRRGGILYSALHRMEQRTIRRAMFLITVARRYRDHLIAQGVPAGRLLLAPCPVDVTQFRPDPMARDRVRHELELGDAITGIYVGKFGGLYLRDEAFRVFTSIHRRLQGRSKLIVLTPDPREEVLRSLEEAGFPRTDARVARVPHERVPEHLNAADFAMALYRRTPSSGFLSPVKVGEYWACGLPVLLTRGVGDEERIIGEGGTGGALFDPAAGDLPAALDTILDRTGPNGQAAIRELALRHRSIEHTRAAYARVLSTLQSSR